MKYKISRDRSPISANIQLPASKSESNRALIIQALAEGGGELYNLSDSDDTQVLIKALKEIEGENVHEINVGHAGTSFRFLTAYLSVQADQEFVLTGSDRMKQRPCGPLVEALVSMGAEISYLEKEGYPPLRIKGRQDLSSNVSIKGNISSQFISALMLIAPKLKNGLDINITSELVSKPYLEMTAQLMQAFHADVQMSESKICIQPTGYVMRDHAVESDWSAASYWYELIALYGGEVSLSGLKSESLQGDSEVQTIFKSFGVKTEFENNVCLLRLESEMALSLFEYDFTSVPDLAQTMMATCAGLGIPCRLTGLSTLKIKETDRILSMSNELGKLGVSVEPGAESIEQSGKAMVPQQIIETYHDHRMALSLAPLAGIVEDLRINEPEVVSKSYPHFWKDLQTVEFELEQV